MMKRSVYQCMGCKQRTLQCKKCSDFAKGNSNWEDENCIICQKLFPNWETATKMRVIKQERWCSWCVEISEHQLIQKNSYTRDICFCCSCNNQTICCMKCMRDMAKFSSFFNVSTFLCSYCYNQVTQKKVQDSFTFWQNLQLKRNLVLDPERWKIEQINSQLVNIIFLNFFFYFILFYFKIIIFIIILLFISFYFIFLILFYFLFLFLLFKFYFFYFILNFIYFILFLFFF